MEVSVVPHNLGIAGGYITSFIGNMTTMSSTMSTNDNTTEDIVRAGCLVDPFSVVACIRYGVMAAVILLTAVLCIHRIYRLHTVRHQALHHYLIFYSSLISCIFCVVHWILGQYAQLDFMAQWFKQLGYLVVTHFFWTRAHRAIRREKLTNFCLLPGLVFGLLYCTVTVLLGVIKVNDYAAACLAIEWVMMSSAELFIAQLFLLAGFFISKRLDGISTIHSVRRSQKLKLWSVVIVFELSAFVGFSYDLSMLAIGSHYANCGKIFHYDQILYSFVFGSFMIIKFALPIWVLLAALDPIEATPLSHEDDDTDSLQSSDQVAIIPNRRTSYRPQLFSRSSSHETSTPHRQQISTGTLYNSQSDNLPT